METAERNEEENNRSIRKYKKPVSYGHREGRNKHSPDHPEEGECDIMPILRPSQLLFSDQLNC